MARLQGKDGDATMGRLNGKVVLITGAGSGIGAATARIFAQEGARVGILDINPDRANDVAYAIQATDGEAMSLTCDISQAAAVANSVQTLLNRWHRLDILINNAAVQIMGALHTFSDDDFDQVVNVNLKGTFLGCRAVLPVLLEQGEGTILFTSSVLGLVADPDLAVYGATKAAIIGLMRSIAVAYGPHGVRAVAVCPGDVDTPLVADYFSYQADPEAARTAINREYPLRRIAAPEEIGRVLAFLASSEASFISGTCITIDGGLLAQVY